MLSVLRFIYDDLGNPWLGGGGAVRAREVAERLAARGHRLTLITAAYPGAPAHEQGRGIAIERLGSPRSYLRSRLTYAIEARSLLRRRAADYDVVVESFSPFSPILAPLWTRRPVVGVFQQVLFGAAHLRRRGPAGVLPWAAEALALRSYLNAITDSPHLARTLESRLRPGHRVVAIPNGVPDELFELPRAEADPPFFLFLGRLDLHQKGLDWLVELWRRHPELPRLVVAGSGKDEAELRRSIAERRLEDRIDMVGRVAGAAKAALLQGALAVCLPSRFESFPVVALEAQAAGCPVVGSRLPSLLEATEPDGSARLTSLGSLSELHQALTELLASAELRRRMGTAGRTFARRFRWDEVARAEEAFLTAVAFD